MIKDENIFINLDNSKEFFDFDPGRHDQIRTMKIKNKKDIRSDNFDDSVINNKIGDENIHDDEIKNTKYIIDDQSISEKISDICEDTLKGVSVIKDIFHTLFSNP